MKENIQDYSKATLLIGFEKLGYIFMDPLRSKRRSQLVFGSIVYAYTMSHLYFILKMLFESDGDISALSRSLASFSTYFQTFLKMSPAIHFRNHIINMVYNRKFFMEMDKENQPELHQKITKLYKQGYMLSKIFSTVVLMTLLMFYMKPFFNKELLLPVFVPDFPYSFEIFLTGQYLYALFVNFIIVGMDIMYISMCIDICAQYRILGFNVVHLKENAKVRKTSIEFELNRCIHHHGFLLRYAYDMKKLYSGMLLGEYLITTVSSCANLFVVQDPNQEFSVKLSAFMYCISLLAQFGIYCFAATMLSSEVSKLPENFYSSKWEEFPVKLRKSIYFALMLSQKPTELKGGGMFIINREAFAHVFKTSFSFMTLMRSMN